MHGCIRAREGGVELRVRLMPRASRNSIQGYQGDRVKIRLTEAPVGGAANDALIAFLSRLVKVPRSRIRIVLGARDRSKTVWLEVGRPDRLADFLEKLIADSVDNRAGRE